MSYKPTKLMLEFTSTVMPELKSWSNLGLHLRDIEYRHTAVEFAFLLSPNFQHQVLEGKLRSLAQGLKLQLRTVPKHIWPSYIQSVLTQIQLYQVYRGSEGVGFVRVMLYMDRDGGQTVIVQFLSNDDVNTMWYAETLLKIKSMFRTLSAFTFATDGKVSIQPDSEAYDEALTYLRSMLGKVKLMPF